VWLAILTMMVFGMIGFIDDYSKVMKKKNLGLTGKRKFSCRLSRVALSRRFDHAHGSGTYSTQLSVPFSKFHPDLVIHSLLSAPYFWWFSYIPFLIFVALVIVAPRTR